MARSMAYKGRVILLKQDAAALHYKDINPNNASLDTADVIKEYFSLHIKLDGLYAQWSEKDPHFKKIATPQFSGIRILRQDPWENLCSFICSTNNNIKRISQMVENLCLHFGDYISTHEGIKYHDFPTPSQLADPSVDGKLRQLGFGYRAKYIQQTAKMISEHPEGVHSLIKLRDIPYKEAHQALLQYVGVGPKVADCVCLMSLDKHDCVPVDTHVWQIAQRDYKFGRNYKTLNKTAYDAVGNFFRDTWGEYAGWAHSVLFTADLRDLKNGVNKSEEPIPSKSEASIVKLEEDIKVQVVKAANKTVKKETRKRKIVQTQINKENVACVKEESPLESVSERLKRRRRGAKSSLLEESSKVF